MKSVTHLQRSSLVKIKMWSLHCTTFSSKSASRRQVSYFKKAESKENLKFWNSSKTIIRQVLFKEDDYDYGLLSITEEEFCSKDWGLLVNYLSNCNLIKNIVVWAQLKLVEFYMKSRKRTSRSFFTDIIKKIFKSLKMDSVL